MFGGFGGGTLARAEGLLSGLGGAFGAFGVAAELHQKAARNRGTLLAPFGAGFDEREREVLFGARDADVAESALLLDAPRIDDGALVREEAFLHADHVHVRKFEALGAVQGHERDGLFLWLVVVFSFAAGERGFFEKTEQ